MWENQWRKGNTFMTKLILYIVLPLGTSELKSLKFFSLNLMGSNKEMEKGRRRGRKERGIADEVRRDKRRREKMSTLRSIVRPGRKFF